MKRRGFFSTVLAAALLLAAAPASAEETTWYPAPCATGEITDHAAGWGSDWLTVAIAGWIRPCPGIGGAEPKDFAVMYHTPNANFITSFEPYESPAAPTSFALRIEFTARVTAQLAMTGGLRGLCLIRSYEHWLSCVAVEWAPDGTPGVAPVAPGDPRLRAPTYEFPPWGGPSFPTTPSCATCANPGQRFGPAIFGDHGIPGTGHPRHR